MGILQVIFALIGIIGFVLHSAFLFKISAWACFGLLTLIFLIRGYRLDKIKATAMPEQEGYIVKLGIFFRVLTCCILFGPLYYFFPTVMSWIVIAWSATSILNVLSSFFNRLSSNRTYH